MRNSRMSLSFAAAAACAALVAAPAAAQRAANQDNTLSLQGGEPLVVITADAPQEARVGQSFDFQILVRNVSESIAVHDLVIAQKGSQQFDIQSSRIEGKQQSGQKKQGQKKQGQKKQGQKKQQQQNQQQNQQGQSQQGQQGKSRWTISQLMPGETRTIHVTAISDSEGQRNVCLAVESYTPALCLSTRFTKPDLQIVKQAPEKVDICETIEYEYFIENAGSADLERFTVEDQLPEGIKTIDGQDSLKFTLEDGLKAGDVRKFVASLWATRTGQFSSRAEVRGPEGVSARSNNPTTQVVKPDLAIAITGPSVREVDSVVNYTVRVTNHGESPAPFSELTLHFPRSTDLVRMGEPRPSSREVQSYTSFQERDNQQQNQAGNQKQNQSGNQKQNQAGNQQQNQQSMARRQWNLGTLQPGQTVEVNYALRPFEGGQLKQIAIAEYVCEVAEEREMDEAMFRVQDQLVTEIVALPGLRLTVIDNKDPVPTGEQVTYTIKVANEGDAEAKDIQVTAKLPQQLEFVEASGETNAKNSQGNITFEPVQTLQPGESASWEVVVKVNEQADKPIQVEMTGSSLKQPITAEEPTTFFSQDQAQRKKQTSGQNQGEKKNQDQNQKQDQDQ